MGGSDGTAVGFNKMYVMFIHNIIEYHNSEMFRLFYSAIFKLELKRHFDTQLAMFLKYEI
jgi:hypothetical protein